MEIRWSKLAVKQLINAIQYLEDAGYPDYADKVQSQILSKVKSLENNFDLYQEDRLMMAVFML